MWRKLQQVSRTVQHKSLIFQQVQGVFTLNSPVSPVSLDNVLLDVKELQRGMELTKREYSMHGHNTMLKDFIAHNESKLKKLQDDAKIAQVNEHKSLCYHKQAERV